MEDSHVYAFAQAYGAALEQLQPSLIGRCTVQDINDSLLALHVCHGRYKSIAVNSTELRCHTLPIVFGDVQLGEFVVILGLSEIVRYLSGKLEDLPIRINALRPQPALSNLAVIHPHVAYGRLCAGEALPLIRGALQTGDIQTLLYCIAAILYNENPEGAYIRSTDWNTVNVSRCTLCGEECGHLASCYECADLICNRCSTYCDMCYHGPYCHDCISTCENCKLQLCEGCSRRCSVCRAVICVDCSATCSSCGAALPCCASCVNMCVAVCSHCGYNYGANQ